MSKIFSTILLFTILLIARGADSDSIKLYSLLTFKQIEAGSPWLRTGNAAGLAQMQQLFPAELKLGYSLKKGDFHSVFKGNSDLSFDFSSQSYRIINKIHLFGSFAYSKSIEKGLNFSNTNDPAINYPYLLTDTIGNDTYDREFFNLATGISAPINSWLDWGLRFDYKVGSASQNRDPRPENKVLQTSVSPGLLLKLSRFKLGANFTLEYYNEDIEVLVVEENAQHTMFQLHGPAAFTSHTTSSFFRLYKQHQYGGGLQAEYRLGNISNLLHSNYSYSVQTIDDGRRGGFALWAAIKNDARMDGIDWNLTNVFSVENGANVHQLRAMLQISNKLGTEFIQRLEKVGATDLEHWITYGEEQKYYSLLTNAGVDYQLMVKDADNRMKSLFNSGIKYSSFSEKYYLPNYSIEYSNLRFSTSYLKNFPVGSAGFSVEVKFNYQLNLDDRRDLPAKNFLANKIYHPELNYLTENYLSPGISLTYQVPVAKLFHNYFVTADFDWLKSESGLTSTIFGFSTGFIF